jgi:carbon storage regulator
MLVLTRKSRESVVVGGADGLHRLLKVTVLDIRGGNVKLGFEADARVPVHREEVWEQINGNGEAENLTRGPAPPAE